MGGFVEPDLLAAAQDNLWDVYPRPDEYFRGPEAHRRSLYTFKKRTAPPPNMLIFDTGSGEKCLARRQVTNTPLQQLALLNDPVFFDKSALLTWQTASEKGNVGFDIEKSTDGKSFAKIGFAKGFGTTQTPQYYTLTDPNLAQLSYYRLRQLDEDGAVTISKVVTVEPNVRKSKLKVYPNPTYSTVTVELPIGKTEGQVVDILGRVLLNQSGSERLVFDLQGFTAGIYFVKVGGEHIRLVKN